MQTLDYRLLIVIMRLLKVNEELSKISFWMLLAAGVGSGAAILSAAHGRKMWRTAEKICSTYLLEASIPAIPLEFKASNPKEKLEVPESRSTLHQFCIVLASFPSLRCSYGKKHLSHAETQSVWSRSCGLQDFVEFLLQANEELPAFQLPMYSMWRTAEKRFVRHVCPGIHASCEI